MVHTLNNILDCVTSHQNFMTIIQNRFPRYVPKHRTKLQIFEGTNLCIFRARCPPFHCINPPPPLRILRGSSHRRKSAACPKFDFVWLYCSPIPVGRSGGNFLVQMISTCLLGEGGGRHPVLHPLSPARLERCSCLCTLPHCPSLG